MEMNTSMLFGFDTLAECKYASPEAQVKHGLPRCPLEDLATRKPVMAPCMVLQRLPFQTQHKETVLWQLDSQISMFYERCTDWPATCWESSSFDAASCKENHFSPTCV